MAVGVMVIAFLWLFNGTLLLGSFFSPVPSFLAGAAGGAGLGAACMSLTPPLALLDEEEATGPEYAGVGV